MSKAAMRAESARLVDAYLLKGGVITYCNADWRSRPRQRIAQRSRKPMPMWMRIAIATR